MGKGGTMPTSKKSRKKNPMRSKPLLNCFVALQQSLDRWANEGTTFRIEMMRFSLPVEWNQVIEQIEKLLKQDVGKIQPTIESRIQRMKKESGLFSSTFNPIATPFARAVEALLNELVKLYGPYPKNTFSYKNKFFHWSIVQ